MYILKTVFTELYVVKTMGRAVSVCVTTGSLYLKTNFHFNVVAVKVT